ncbi:MAG: hypothetical protein Q7T82_01710 [Armatimonadota bacterium]|nr:hypothetical protein [Armatimonadota bacterium]
MYSALAPDWLHAVRLLITFLITATLGAHAFYKFRVLTGTASPKLWTFFLYAMAFILSSTLNFVALLITVATRSYGPMPKVSLGPFTVLLVITYAALAVTSRPTRA